ncbi:hypothetical protein NDK47_27230 [Brevibacillus ruminantium]|uniref:Uncharacterized protein n=1 Tax=Brevibacillus ruminantium TaxID=2950604 RepID=A0ABY4WFY8_9BACL|nr:hypothetical protein [Brevibacillus ruminantium]USG65746.1 hypothetical protein NDK47_27230 [Brevibacillus ruminantium]
MLLIKHRKTRKLLFLIIKRIQKEFIQNPEKHNLSISKTDILNIERLLIRRQIISKRESNKYLKSETSFSYLSIICISYLGFAVLQGQNGRSPIPKTFFEINEKPDPNFVLQNLLMQIANHSLAIVNLVNSGLDTSARTLLRGLLELSWLTVVVIAEKDNFKRYFDSKNEEAEKGIWRKYFSINSLNSSLEEIEKKLGLSEEVINELKEIRSKSYTYYSRYLHNSYACVMLGPYSFSFKDMESMHISLFGKASMASKQTLGVLNWNLVYLILLIWPILYNIHNFTEYRSDLVWLEALSLREAVLDVYEINNLSNE